METRKENGFWKRIEEGVARFFEELRKESVSNSTRKPADCCNVPSRPEVKPEDRN